MQFPVPQFTDVEDKIFGPLTLKQFGIIFGVGVIIFLAFSATKSILVLIFFAFLFGLPGVALAFGKINGRPIYNSLGVFIKFFSSPKVLVFHKEAGRQASLAAGKKADAVPVPTPPLSAGDTQSHLKEVQALLAKTAASERDVAQKMQ